MNPPQPPRTSSGSSSVSGTASSTTYHGHISDLSRVILLGIAFDISRLVARGALNAVSSALCQDNDNHANNGAATSDIPKIGMALGNAYRRSTWPRRIGLFLWLLIPPPLIFYGVWNNRQLLNDDSKPRHHQASWPFSGGMYLSSILTSLGLMFWMYPSQGGDEEVHGDDNESNGNNKMPRFVPLPHTEQDEEHRPRSDSFRSVYSESSANTPTINAPPAEIKSHKKYLEMLVHNVSHTDMILGLSGNGMNSNATNAAPSFLADYEKNPRRKTTFAKDDTTKEARTNIGQDNTDEKYLLSVPRFSAFDMFSRRVFKELQRQMGNASLDERIISYPRYERSNATARYTLVTPRPEDRHMLPVGFNLEQNEEGKNVDDDVLSVDQSDMPSLRLRGRDLPKVDPSILGETPRKKRCTVSSSKPTFGNLSPLDEQLGNQEVSGHVSLNDKLRINAVFFPLLSSLLARWLGQIADKYGGVQSTSNVSAPLHNPNVKKVMVLVSGVGTPRNWTHSVSGNSTEACAELMELFINVLYPDVTVVRIHSDTNILRYDENITFATQELMPCIDSFRDANARGEPYPDEKSGDSANDTECNEFNPDWKQFVSVTYSFADGSSARTHAIQAALRPYRPTYFHFWQLKTFWHESKITDEDIEVHSFEEMETVPAIAVDQTTDNVRLVVNEMKAFRKDFIETLEKGRSDLKSFWLRKSKKPVLAVLLVHKPGSGFVFYRGTNMEVSMPTGKLVLHHIRDNLRQYHFALRIRYSYHVVSTIAVNFTGSLCAERNAIGTALASDPGLKREDLIMVAVLAVPMPEVSSKQISPPPGPLLCRKTSSDVDAVDFAREVEEKLKQHQSGEEMCNVSSSFASTSDNKTENDEWQMEIPELNVSQIEHSEPLNDVGDVGGSSTPRRRLALYESSNNRKTLKQLGRRMKKRQTTWVSLSLEVRVCVHA